MKLSDWLNMFNNFVKFDKIWKEDLLFKSSTIKLNKLIHEDFIQQNKVFISFDNIIFFIM